MMEDFNAANVAFALCPMLGLGAVEAIEAHGSEELKRDYLPKIVSGEWTATMNLTEPQAGSDVGALKSRAVPAGDGSWRITGTKIFITYGEHDLTDNIIHMVLARTPGAPEGTKGISLFLVPKVLPDGSPNDLHCVSIEHKMGIHASPTCVMAYGENGGATGWLVGDELGGMRAMFTMMNNARLNVGLQGVGLAERATQRAVAYALERKQGQRDGLPITIAEHPDVRRMLVRMRALTMAARALAYYAFGQLDRGDARRSRGGSSRGRPHAAGEGMVHGRRLRSRRASESRSTAAWASSRRPAPLSICATRGSRRSMKARTASRPPISCQRKIGLDDGAAFDALDRGHSRRSAARGTDRADRRGRSAGRDGTQCGAGRPAVGSYPLMTMTAVLTAGWLMERLGRAIDAGEGEGDSANAGRRAAIEYFLSVVVPEALGLGAGAAAGCGSALSRSGGGTGLSAFALDQLGRI